MFLHRIRTFDVSGKPRTSCGVDGFCGEAGCAREWNANGFKMKEFDIKKDSLYHNLIREEGVSAQAFGVRLC